MVAGPGFEGGLDADPLFLALSEATADSVALVDPSGVVRTTNAAGRKDLGAQPGLLWSSLWGEEHRAELERALSAALRGAPARIRTFRGAKDEAPEWWDTTVAPVRREGAVISLVATSRNVTAEIEARSILDTVIEYAPAVLFAKDATNGRFIMLNRAAEEYFGKSKEEMIGKTSAELFDDELAAHHEQIDREIARTGRVHVNEVTVRTEFGEERIFKTRVMATFGDEGARHLIGISEDVTDERAQAEALKAAADRAEAANRSKSEFLANMSHEIRTPLNGVVAVADVLARTQLEGQQREMVEIIRSSGVTLERLLSDVLDLARIESGAIEIQKDPFHLADAVRAVATLLSMRAQEKGVALKVAIAPEAEAWVLSDVVRVKQVVTNLTSNAIKFTDQGEVCIEVACLGGPTERPTFQLSVRDTGVGFDPANKDRVFGRFQQADGSITRRFGGTGLGLSISRQLVELMEGQLDCDSQPGVGSTFWAVLPFAITEAPVGAYAAAAEVAGGDGAEDAGRALRVLLADDHPTNRKVVELILQPLGVDLVSVEDGRQAVEAFAGGGFDVVLMDMQMPVMDGLAATREIRRMEREAGVPRTPLFMLTANALPEHLELSRKAGADRHLSKPITADALIVALNEAIAEQEEAAEVAAASAA